MGTDSDAAREDQTVANAISTRAFVNIICKMCTCFFKLCRQKRKRHQTVASDVLGADVRVSDRRPLVEFVEQPPRTPGKRDSG